MKENESPNSKKSLRTDGKEYNFLGSVGAKLDNMLQKVNDIMDLMTDSKPYKLNYKDVIKEYLAHGVGDIDEFASGYTFHFAMHNGHLSNKIIKQAVYEDIRKYLWDKKELGEIR